MTRGNLDLANFTSVDGFKILGSTSSDGAGYSVSSAGDINGDGVNDVILGASRSDPSGRDLAGTSYVIYGKAGGLTDVDLLNLTPAQGFKILGAVAGDLAGISVSNAGDMNKDGVNDVILGAHHADSSGRDLAGTSYVIYGKSGGVADVDLLNLTPAQGFKILGAASSNYAGGSVSNAGDINGDGVNDIILGAHLASLSGRSNAGTSYVIYGKAGGVADVDLLYLTTAQGFKISGAASDDQAGISVSSAGDINVDGVNDVILGAYRASHIGRTNAGTVYVIYGKSGGVADVDLLNLTPAQGFKILGAVSGDGAGNSVSSAGDINGDGVNDVIVGASQADPSGRDLAGTSYVIYGKAGGMADLDLFTLTSAQGFKILGAVAGDLAGSSVSSAGDINWDGINDVLIGAYQADHSGRTQAGMSYVIYGKSGGVADVDLLNLTPAQGFKILGAASDDWAGYSVSSAGDINVDGVNDVILGALRADYSGRGDAGAAYVVYGRKDITASPSFSPTRQPTIVPTLIPTVMPTIIPTSIPTVQPTVISTTAPTAAVTPTAAPSSTSTVIPTSLPTAMLTHAPTLPPTKAGTNISDATWSYETTSLAVRVNLIDRTAIVGDNIDVLSIYIENIKGSGFNDILIGDTNANRLEGNAGDDLIEGGGDADILDGGIGTDTASYKTSGSGVVVSLKPGASNQGGDAEGDMLSSIENLVGSAYSDLLIGNGPAVNRLEGGAGDDVLEASDNDILVGGSGKDTFKINEGTYSVTVTDFDETSEQIDLRAWGIQYKNLRILDDGSSGSSVQFLDNSINKQITITLASVSRSELSESNFIFVQLPPEPPIDWKKIVIWVCTTVGGAAVAAVVGYFINKYLNRAFPNGISSASCCRKAGTTTAKDSKESDHKANGHVQDNGIEIAPIGIALSANPIDLISLVESQTSFDYFDNGIKIKTSWVGPKDAFLVYDHNDNRQVDAAKELVLTQWSSIATTDFMALKEVFDSNKDNKFDANDAEFNRFHIWQDKNQDGISQRGELRSLSEAGLLQIDFNIEQAINGEFFGKQQEMQVAGVSWSNGHQTLAYDLALSALHEA